MPRQTKTVAERFEDALIETVRKLRVRDQDPAFDPVRRLLLLLETAASRDEKEANFARTLLKDLQRVHEYVRLNDNHYRQFDRDPGTPRKAKVALELKREHLPPHLLYVYDLARNLWPLLPYVNFLHRARGSATEVKIARLYEHIFVMLCTRPDAMRPEIEALAAETVARRARRFPGLDVAGATEAVMGQWYRRRGFVARHRAEARTIREAAERVRGYVQRAVRTRFKDVVRGQLEPEITESASTLRRWRHKDGIRIENATHAEQIRAEKEVRMKHGRAGRVSLNSLAKHLGRARSTTTNALRVAEAKHGFKAERGEGGTILLTPTEARQVEACLPPARTRGAARKRRSGRV
jgi:hypothetical protein